RVSPRSLPEGQTDRGEANAGNGKDVPRHAGLSSTRAVRIEALAGDQRDRSALRPRQRLEDWRECKCKHDQCGCEYFVSIFHFIFLRVLAFAEVVRKFRRKVMTKVWENFRDKETRTGRERFLPNLNTVSVLKGGD